MPVKKNVRNVTLVKALGLSKKRVKEHVDYILRLFSTQATGQHYNMPEHDLSNMAITVLEKVHKYDDFYRQER